MRHVRKAIRCANRHSDWNKYFLSHMGTSYGSKKHYRATWVIFTIKVCYVPNFGINVIFLAKGVIDNGLDTPGSWSNCWANCDSVWFNVQSGQLVPTGLACLKGLGKLFSFMLFLWRSACQCDRHEKWKMNVFGRDKSGGQMFALLSVLYCFVRFIDAVSLKM